MTYVNSSKFDHVYFQVGVVLLENPVGSNTITTPSQLLQEVEGLFGQGVKRLFKDKEGQIEVREVSAATSGQVRSSTHSRFHRIFLTNTEVHGFNGHGVYGLNKITKCIILKGGSRLIRVTS